MLLPRLALVLMLVMRQRRNFLSVLLLVVVGVHRVMMRRWGRVVVLRLH